MGVYNVGEGGLGQTYGPTAQLIAAYVVLRRPIAIGVAPNCISKRLGNRTPGGRDRALFTPDSQPIAVQLPAGRYSRNSWGTLDLRGGIRVRCRARGGKLWITGDGQVDKVLPSVCERSVSRAGRETVHKTTAKAGPRSAPATLTPAPMIRPAMMASAAFCRVSPAKRRAGAGARPIRSPPMTLAAIMATASLPRRTGRGMESEAAAADRGATDKALVGLLFQGGLRRSEAAALRWAAPPLRCERSSADTG